MKKMNAIPYTECRAKTCPDGSPGTFVYDHCRYAGYVAEALLALLPESIRILFPKETPFLVSLHDIGKVSPEYEIKYFESLIAKYAQEWLLTFRGKSLRGHASIGAISLITGFELFFDDSAVSAIAAHHGFVPSGIDLRPKDDLGDIGIWQSEREKLVIALANEFGASTDSISSVQCPVDLLAGVMCVSDWIASDETFFPPSEPPLTSVEGRHRASTALKQCGFQRAEFQKELAFCDIFGFEPYPAQRAFIDVVTKPGVYVLEAPMGMGKTEAALYVAYRLIEEGFNSGIYFALPTRLTSDRIHKRVETFLEKVSIDSTAVKLAHGQAWLKEYEKGAEGSSKEASKRPPPWFNPSKRGLIFPFAVGTIDQALLAVLNVKHSFVRSFALAGKVVILDEVHSYDAYTGTLLDELVARLRELGCTVIILSATLTAARRRSLLRGNVLKESGYPLLTGIRSNGESVVYTLEPPKSRDVHLRWIDGAVDSPVDAAIEKARTGCNVLCIANTVATAQEWFRVLKSKIVDDEFPIGLLHAKFTSRDRDRIEEEWMDKLGKPAKEDLNPRPHGSILVSTQIVEQSVDIDADWMLSELAPIDMLLQRLGRLWRHERLNRPIKEPELAVVCARMPANDLSNLPSEIKDLEAFFGRGVWVYAPYVLLRTFEILKGYDVIRIPDDIRRLLEAVYAETIPNTSLHNSLFNDMQEKAERLRRLAIMGQSNALPTRNDNEETAGTRYNSRPSVSLLVVREFYVVTGRATLLDGTEVTISQFERNFEVTKALYQNLVQVAPNDILQNVDDEKTNRLLRLHFFTSDMPRICLWNKESGVLNLYNSMMDVGYVYHSEFGAYRVRGLDEASLNKSEALKFNELPNKFYFSERDDW